MTLLYFKIGMNKNKKYKTEVLSGAPVISWDWTLEQFGVACYRGLGVGNALSYRDLQEYHPPWESLSAGVLQ